MQSRPADSDGGEGRRDSPDSGFDDRVFVEVVYVRGALQVVRLVAVPNGATAAEVIESSGLKREFNELSGAQFGLACFGRRMRMDTRIAPGDRIEILLPLEMSPKEARRRLAAERAKRS